MRWTLAQARLALFTASALGLARPGVAQQSPYLPIGTPTPASKMRPDAHPYATVNQHQAMTDAIKIELAWLADPATFPCRLGTYQDGENLKVRGFVPNQAVKIRAIEIAGHQTAMPLIDELRINSNMPMPVAGIPVDKILGDAAQALVKQLGDKANPLELTASVSGQIVVSGTLTTPADQLVVSHCLRAVHGCTSVKNLVTVPGFSAGSTVTSKVSTAKKPEAVTAPKVVSLPDAKANPPKMVTRPEPKANIPNMVMTPDAKAAAPKAETVEAPATPTGTEISKFKTLTLKGTTADASKDVSKTLTLPAPSTDVAKPSQSVMIIKIKDSPKPTALPGATVVLPATTGSVIAHLSEANQPITESERKVPASERKTAASDTTNVITADVKMKDKPTKKVELVSHATPIIPADKTSELPEGAYVASGVITYDEAPTKSTPMSRTDSSIARLKDRVESVCGHAGKNVEVHASPGNRLTIKVQCATREEGERLSKQILELRELAPYEVSLDMKLVP